MRENGQSGEALHWRYVGITVAPRWYYRLSDTDQTQVGTDCGGVRLAVTSPCFFSSSLLYICVYMTSHQRIRCSGCAQVEPLRKCLTTAFLTRMRFWVSAPSNCLFCVSVEHIVEILCKHRDDGEEALCGCPHPLRCVTVGHLWPSRQGMSPAILLASDMNVAQVMAGNGMGSSHANRMRHMKIVDGGRGDCAFV